MQPLGFLTGVVLGSAASISLVLLMVAAVFAFAPGAAPAVAGGPRPVLPPGLPQLFVPARGSGDGLVYQAAVLAEADVFFRDARSGLSATKIVTRVAPLAATPDWAASEEPDFAVEDLVPLLEKPVDLLVCELAHVSPEKLFALLKGRPIARIMFVHLSQDQRENLKALQKLASHCLDSDRLLWPSDGEQFALPRNTSTDQAT